MKRLRRYGTYGFALLLIALMSNPGTCLPYSVSYLSSNNYPLSDALSINDFGQIVGYLGFPGYGDKLVMWNSTTATPFTIYDGRSGGVISNTGDVAGEVTEDYQWRAFLWTPESGLTYPSDLPGVAAINSARQVAGNISHDDTITPFIWTPSSGVTEITGFNGLEGVAYGINESGQVVGWGLTPEGYAHSFLWSSTTGVTDLTPDAEWSTAVALNDAGQVAGVYTLPDQRKAIFTWTENAGLSVLAPFAASIDVDVFALNDAGTIVGALYDHSE